MEIKEVDPSLIDQMVYIEQEAQIKPWSKNLLQSCYNYDYYTILGAFDESQELIGFLIFDEIAKDSNIQEFSVLPSYQNKGVGTALLNKYFELLHSHQMERSLLEVRAQNIKARSLYKKFNYKEIAIRKNYYAAPTEDAIIMEINL